MCTSRLVGAVCASLLLPFTSRTANSINVNSPASRSYGWGKLFWLIIPFTGLTTGTVSATTLLQAYAYSVDQQSGTSTHGPTTTFDSSYPGGSSDKFYPVYDSTVTPSEDFNTGASGPQTATSSASGSGNSTNGTWSGSSSSNASASYGQLGAYATASSSGSGDNGSLLGSQAFATAQDTFTITGGSGLATFRPTYTIDGSWTNSGTFLQLEFDYSINNGATYDAYRIQGGSGYGYTIWYNGYQTSLPGLILTSNSVTGSTQISFDVTFAFGTSFDLTTALYAAAVPSNSSSGTVDFASTARLTGISILQGINPITGFTIQSGSGTQYTAEGVVVPLPAAVWLFGSGMLGLVGVARRKNAA